MASAVSNHEKDHGAVDLPIRFWIYLSWVPFAMVQYLRSSVFSSYPGKSFESKMTIR